MCVSVHTRAFVWTSEDKWLKWLLSPRSVGPRLGSRCHYLLSHLSSPCLTSLRSWVKSSKPHTHIHKDTHARVRACTHTCMLACLYKVGQDSNLVLDWLDKVFLREGRNINFRVNFSNVLRNKLCKHENSDAGCSLSVRVGVY